MRMRIRCVELTNHMYTHKRVIPCIYYAWIFLFGAASFSYGQEQLPHKGPLRLGEYEGSAKYEYKLVEGDTLLDGAFSFQSLGNKTLTAEGDQYFSFWGPFHMGQPDSTWQFRFGEFYPEKGTELINFFVQVKVSGIQHNASISFREGTPQGDWIHTVESIENSSVQKTIFKSQVPFDEGVPHGTFRIENDSLTLLGRFLPNGLAHDIWELNFEAEVGRLERWHFVQGRLKKIEIQNSQGLDSLMLFTNEIPDAKVVNLDDRYVNILGIQSNFDPTRYSQLGGTATQLIAENASYYRQLEKAFSSFERFSSPFSKPDFGVKVGYFPLDSLEQTQVELIRKRVQLIETSSQALRENTRLKLLKHSDEDILFLLSAVKEIFENYLAPARKIVQYADEGILDFLPRESLGPSSEIRSEALTEIPISYQDSSGTLKTRTFIGPFPEKLTPQSRGIAYLSSLSAYAWACVDSIERKLDHNLQRQKLQQELEKIEKSLLAQEESLIHWVDSLGADLAEPYRSTLKALTSTSDHLIRQYNLEEDASHKPDLARDLITCIQELEQLAASLAKLPERREEIQELYTEQVWNPFTATIMTDQVKGRIIQAYDELLIPSIMESIRSELTCGNTQVFRSMLDDVYKRMCELRKKNTSKLERKLKKEDDPRIVMQLFELSL